VNFLEATLAALALLSLALALWQWLAARRFPLHRRVTEPSSTPAGGDEAPTLAAERRPAITSLKPLKGCDATTAESLQSWFNQNYPGQIQILFGVADASDPVCKIVRELIEKNPGRDAQLVVCAESLGANGKVSTLIQLERLAKHPLILVSDADVRVPPDFLANITAPLRDSKVGLVNCFYRLANPATTAMRCEAVAINADFWSQVLQSTNLKPLDFALGAAMLTRRKLLEEIGGFAAWVNCLADDYQLGHRIAQRGHRIALCPVVVECWDAPMNWCEVWKHQLRWARTIRVCRPLPYFFSILSNATLWPLLWLIASLVWSKTLCAPLIAVVCLLIRMVLAQNLQRRFMQSRDNIAPPWLAPVKDLQQAAIWAGAFLGNTVEWRGQKMCLRRDGTLIAEK
jgi:ceramide glucosyltransferase